MNSSPSRVPTRWATNHPVPVGWMRQFRYLASLYDQVRNVEGEIVECGLGEGNTFAMLAYLTGSEQGPRQRGLWGFDSFEGWPEPCRFDESPRKPTAGEWRVSREMVTSRLEESGIYRTYPNLVVTIIGGFLRDTLPRFDTRPLALIHLDVDLYEGYRDGLEHLFPQVATGGIVAFDEYREFPRKPEYGNGTVEKWPGCTKAVNDYFQGRPEKPTYHEATGKYYVVKTAE